MAGKKPFESFEFIRKRITLRRFNRHVDDAFQLQSVKPQIAVERTGALAAVMVLVVAAAPAGATYVWLLRTVRIGHWVCWRGWPPFLCWELACCV